METLCLRALSAALLLMLVPTAASAQSAPSGHYPATATGLAIPVGEWIKGPLRPWAEDLLDPPAMAAEGWFDPAIVERRWRDHLAGRRDSAPALWAILMFQSWLREEKGSLALAA